MDEYFREKFKEIDRKFNLVEAKLSYTQEGLRQTIDAFGDLRQEFQKFYALFDEYTLKIDQRFSRLEKHVGLE
jgi:hypothetical protein